MIVTSQFHVKFVNDTFRSLDPLFFPMDIKVMYFICCGMSEEAPFCCCEKLHVWKARIYCLASFILFVVLLFHDVVVFLVEDFVTVIPHNQK